jgi:hypothetical protein
MFVDKFSTCGTGGSVWGIAATHANANVAATQSTYAPPAPGQAAVVSTPYAIQNSMAVFLPIYGTNFADGAAGITTAIQTKPNPSTPANLCNYNAAQAGTFAGLQVALADGSVRTVDESKSSTTIWQNALNPQDGQVLPGDWSD